MVAPSARRIRHARAGGVSSAAEPSAGHPRHAGIRANRDQARDKAIPYATRDGLTLAADIRRRDAMDLLIVPAAAFTGTGEPAGIDDPQLLAVGRFLEPHPPAWKEAAYAAESLLAVIGPDDIPALDPARARENPRQALAGLWLFKAAIAAVHLVMPGPLAQS